MQNSYSFLLPANIYPRVHSKEPRLSRIHYCTESCGVWLVWEMWAQHKLRQFNLHLMQWSCFSFQNAYSFSWQLTAVNVRHLVSQTLLCIAQYVAQIKYWFLSIFWNEVKYIPIIGIWGISEGPLIFCLILRIWLKIYTLHFALVVSHYLRYISVRWAFPIWSVPRKDETSQNLLSQSLKQSRIRRKCTSSKREYCMLICSTRLSK